ncbi:MAG: cold-shock protein [Flavobacteriales bacterium]
MERHNKHTPQLASSGSFNKREKEKKRQQNQEEKERRKEERKANATGGGLDSMLAYVDENGMITSTPPDPSKRKEVSLEDIEIGVPRREHEEVSNEHTGRIDFFDTSKGFGFIKEDGTQERYFVHVSGLLDEVTQNDKVIFETERGPRGMNAVRVRKG